VAGGRHRPGAPSTNVKEEEFMKIHISRIHKYRHHCCYIYNLCQDESRGGNE